MRNFGESINLDSVLPHMKAGSERQALQVLAREAGAICGLPERDIFTRLVERVSNGRSGIGEGVAIPHLRLRRLSKPCVIFARLDAPIEYNAVDGQPVDLICLVLSPEVDGALNLQRLALITRVLKSAAVCESLRAANSADAIRVALMQSDSLMKAA